ncbi:glucose-induced degradation protein 8 homolog [Drosophila hydei]|uniref:Glucose-induced degradation protein 8 homolog n=1 Tax=Drosophila hydei TaxID=7224 RepID=A0A6J2SW45_DROHY|nr:glucose-induced degradation protein 8 homolog [Drosophila hydei]
MAGSNQRTGWPHRMKSFQSKQADINWLIMKYLVAEGYLDVAQGFEAVARLESETTQLDPVEYQKRIKNAVRTAQVQYAIDMAKRLYPKLFESENYMYFHMQQLHLIELIRESNNYKNSVSSKTNIELDMERTAQRSVEEKRELDSALRRGGHTACMEPKMMFLVKLILWAQQKLNKDGCAVRCDGFDLEMDDFEFELKRAMQNN